MEKKNAIRTDLLKFWTEMAILYMYIYIYIYFFFFFFLGGGDNMLSVNNSLLSTTPTGPNTKPTILTPQL